MTQQKHLKQRIRARMNKTGERYAAAHRQIVGGGAADGAGEAPPVSLAGMIPTTTALRVLLDAAGVVNPATGRRFTEAMLFGIAGGIGIGVFSFLYEKENFASFFVAGRHRWHDDGAYLLAAFERLGVEVATSETGGKVAAAAALKLALSLDQPVIAFLDAGLLPHRALPEEAQGGGYHVVTVSAIDEVAGTAAIGDLAASPISVPLATLGAARARIKKFRNRLMSLRTAAAPPPLAGLVRAGLAACVDGLAGKGGVPGSEANFSLSALATWAGRLDGTGKQSWADTFAPGPRLWNGLTMLYESIQHRGTGGGLCRPIFAAFLTEAAATLSDDRLSRLAAGYAGLGQAWTELAEAALPPGVPAFRQARTLMARRAALQAAAGADVGAGVNAVMAELTELGRTTGAHFPLSEAQAASLRAELAGRVRAIHAEEVRLHHAIGAWLGESAG